MPRITWSRYRLCVLSDPTYLQRTWASGGRGDVGSTWDSREPGPVPDLGSAHACVTGEQVLQAHAVRLCGFSSQCRQAKAVLHTKEAALMWLVAG